ncbi:uncharacterized protein METZ01_LOCUS58321 [marine metagenome]|uniref:Uncharacterized protein n=1 Tax=marine metagenome TaxID=408172 RepID=A0A381SSW2_9ZZZZ
MYERLRFRLSCCPLADESYVLGIVETAQKYRTQLISWSSKLSVISEQLRMSHKQ